ncbi:Thg1-domain-containing protein [Cucurbitaria berberidis CBS 394.84]|uniref:tRNA(His) guanylyltransferase n=1 Tax=Cucurbitaria berberidis CBS 394.84 TaxID=1168544 RepID=A0A9P4GUH3_9PLEO|nr:Thg1-domain-containing protein [Cucurbitaria berberidis CBS 394.84]KAF1851499.1 Thg1-domain-containing protein [Cucurbitaria berberidis CBS 394.84]
MANSKYGYVRSFEQPDSLLSNTWIVVRIDGRGFSKLTAKYKFIKPNDRNALDLMNAAAEAVMKELPDLVLAYGNSDEYSFVFHKDCVLFERRASKLTTTIVSTFTSYYVFLWSTYFPDKPLTPPLPSFDGRAVCYPSDINLRDYMSWRQVDCHINNLYNTTFWTLVQQGGMGAQEAEQRLSGTVSSDKNEILFKDFGINYNNEPECFKKGTVLYRDFFPTPAAQRTSLQTLAAFPSPPIASPQPTRPYFRPVSQPIGRTIPYPQDQVVSPGGEGPGPTFLSTTSTPSPPPSSHTMLKTAFPNPLRSNPISPRTSTYPPTSSMPLSPPSTVTSPYGNSISPHAKQGLPLLTPLLLSPPTLKPSTKPPLSLNPPNPTTRTNFSPTSSPRDFPTAFPISGYTHNTSSRIAQPVSHSASASMSTAGPSKPRLKHRSPSQPQLPTYFTSGNSSSGGPPAIPLRMSSIPTNNKPRKLALQNQRSISTLKPTRQSPEGKENIANPAQITGSMTPRKVSPPLFTNKELPSPPIDTEEEMRTREKVMRSSPQQEWASYTTASIQEAQRRVSDSDKRDGHVWVDQDVSHAGTKELPTASTSTQRARNHSRLHSAPAAASSYSPYPATQALSSTSSTPKPQPIPSASATTPNQDPDIPQTLPQTDSPSLKAAKPKPKPQSFSLPNASKPLDTEQIATPLKSSNKGTVSSEQGGWNASTQHANEGRPVHMSRTQKDKERKKRSKAKVLMEHIDIIRDEFWEKRPWILSGKTG